MKNVKMALIKGTTYRATITGEIVNKFGRPLHSSFNGTSTITCIMTSKNVKLQTTTARLVWTAFKGDIPKGMIIEHKDGNIKNNALCNLKLTTRQARMASPNVKARMNAKPRNRFGVKYDKLVN